MEQWTSDLEANSEMKSISLGKKNWLNIFFSTLLRLFPPISSSFGILLENFVLPSLTQMGSSFINCWEAWWCLQETCQVWSHQEDRGETKMGGWSQPWACPSLSRCSLWTWGWCRFCRLAGGPWELPRVAFGNNVGQELSVSAQAGAGSDCGNLYLHGTSAGEMKSLVLHLRGWEWEQRGSPTKAELNESVTWHNVAEVRIQRITE